MTVKSNVSYASKKAENKMDIYLSRVLSSIPVVFWMHGGAYGGGDKRDYQDYLELLSVDTKQVIVNINYALAPKSKHATPVQQLSLLEHTQSWTQSTFLTDGNDKTFTNQMNGTAKVLKAAHRKVTRVSYSKEVAKLGHT